jgi:hypothetical protein
MAWDTSRRGELAEEVPDTLHILRYAGVDLGVSALQVDVGYYRRASVPWSGEVDYVGVTFVDKSVQMDVYQI